MTILSELSERIIVLLPVAALCALVVFLGMPAYDRLSLDYFLAAPADHGRSGGIAPILFNTIVILGGALILALPTALAAAVAGLLFENDSDLGANAMSRVVVGFLEVGVSVPRLMWGLVGALFFGGWLGLGITAATGILTLTCLLVPIMATGFIDGLRRESQRFGPTLDGLGIPPMVGIVKIIVPAAASSILTSVLLATGRALGDAAALLLTAGISMHALSSLDQSASTLAVMIYFLAVDVGGGRDAALSAAFVLLLLMALIQLPSYWLGQRDRD